MTGQAAPEREASPPHALDDEAFAALVQEAQADLVQGVEKAGLGRDPYRFVIGALAQALGVLPVFMGRLDGALDHARQPVDLAVVERSMTQAIDRLEKASARGVNRHALELVRAHNLRTLLIYGGAFVGAVLAAVGGGFVWGQASANSAVHETEQQLALAFRDGPSAAATWAKLMTWNDVTSSMATCTSNSVKPIDGRRACALPVWIEAPNLAVPTRAR